MPVYCYETESGEIVERFYDMGKAPASIRVKGEPARRCLRVERVGVPSTTGWPIECYASGVHASQAGELRDYLKKKGVPTEVTPEGDPIYTDATHKRKALKARGFIDRNSFS
jgi:hypothetical protein